MDSVSSQKNWRVFFFGYSLMLLFALPLQELPPLFPLIGRDIHISHSQEGFLMGSYGIPGLFMPVAAALLAAKYNTRRMIVAGALIMASGLFIFSFAGSYWILTISRLMAGIGGKIILSLAPLLVISAFRSGSLGVVIGLFNTAVPLGSILSLNLFGYFGPRLGWRLSTTVIAVVAVGMAVVSAIMLRGVSPSKENEALAEKGRKINPLVWSLAVINFLINVITLAYITFAGQFYQTAGASAPEANFLTSLILVVSVTLGPAVGFVVDRWGCKKTLLFLSSCLLAVSLSLLGRPESSLVLWTVVLGIGAAIVPVVVFPLLNEGLREKEVSLGIAILIIASNLGGTIGPFVFGWILDISGSFRVAFMTFAMLSLVILLVLPRLRGRKIITPAIASESPESGM